jgi:N-acetylmuramoyl-L-alanine amidase
VRRATLLVALALGSLLVGVEVPAPASAAPPAPSAIKPVIVWKRIPFGAKRKRQMAAYSRRHYGEREWRLSHPNVIVEHYTAGTSFDSAWNTFASNAVHLGEKPGTCAHFIIDTDGTVYQLVNLGIRCRHAVGMNWTAIGIEHVGMNARGILNNARMMRASLRLTSWLMVKYDINIGNVIGHNETLESRYHRELYPDWRCQTHADWNHAEMRVYRRRLKRVANRLDVPLGAGPHWVDSGC